VYTAGHSATDGDELVRIDLCEEAIRLSRILVELMPDEPEAVGLLALLLLADARRPARTAADGSFVRLADQDRTMWNRDLVTEGHRLVRACLRRNRPGPFQLQAAIAAVHADAATVGDTDWRQIVALYDQLYAVRPDAVVAMNRAIAVGELHGATAALGALETINPAQLGDYQPFHAAHADLLVRAGRGDEARAAYDRAIALTKNKTEREFLIKQRSRVPG
jgi:RNA polymerase sigma-70 factor (ECF subfamily)